MSSKIAVVYYSTYGHVKQLADSIIVGLKSSGAEATLLQVQETLSEEILQKMGAPSKDKTIEIATAERLKDFDGILFGMPTRFGMCPAQMKAFLDSTGGLWMQQALSKKTAGVFFSTGSQGGGQETTALTFLTQFTHHGMIYVPFGFGEKSMGNYDEIRGGSAYGPGTIAGGDGSRQPSKLEKDLAKAYGVRFGSITNAFVAGSIKKS